MRTANRIVSFAVWGLAAGVAPLGSLAQPAQEAEAGQEAEAAQETEVAQEGEAALTATQRALEELSAAYESLAGLLDQGSGEAVQRVQGDIENLGDWEYRIVELEDADAEALEAELNTLGNERWEVYWVEATRDGIRFYLKRPSISYLSRVPLSTLLRMLAAGGQ